METAKSRFNKSAAVAATVGAKVSNDVRSEVTFERQPNRLTFNAMASDVLRAKGGMYIKIFVNPDAEDMNSRFAIAMVSEDVPGAAKIAQVGNTPSVGRPCSFNYAGVWSQAYQFDPQAIPVGLDALKEKGMVDKYVTTKNIDGSVIETLLGKKKVAFTLEKLEDEGITDGVPYQALYALVDGVETELGDPSISERKEASDDIPQTPTIEEAKPSKRKGLL